jgi:hypothetical protein
MPSEEDHLYNVHQLRQKSQVHSLSERFRWRIVRVEALALHLAAAGTNTTSQKDRTESSGRVRPVQKRT